MNKDLDKMFAEIEEKLSSAKPTHKDIVFLKYFLSFMVVVYLLSCMMSGGYDPLSFSSTVKMIMSLGTLASGILAYAIVDLS